MAHRFVMLFALLFASESCRRAEAIRGNLRATAPASADAGAELKIAFEGVDAAGAPGAFAGTIKFRSSDSSASLPREAYVALGAEATREFTVVLKTAGPQSVVVEDASNSHALASMSIVVSAARVSRLLAAASARVSECPPFDVELGAYDAFGNVDPLYQGTVHFSAARAEAALPADYKFTQADSGRHVFAVGGAAPRTITASDTAAHFEAQVDLVPQGWCGIGPAVADVMALAVDPSSPQTVYAAAAGGVYQSADAGITWKPINDGFTSSQFGFALAIAPGNPSTVYAGMFGGIYARTGDAPWTLLPSGINHGGEALAVVLDPRFPGTIYVGTGVGVNGAGILRSRDGGQSWSPVNDGLPSTSVGVTALAVDPVSSDVYAAFGSADSGVQPMGVFRSADGGSTWSSAGLAAITVSSLTATRKGIVYAGTPTGLVSSSDGGRTWSAPLWWWPDAAIAIDPNEPSILELGSAYGVVRSTDGGRSWTMQNGTPTRALAFAGGSSTTLYAGTESEGVSRSDDAGASWINSSVGLAGGLILSLATDPAGHLYAGTRGGWVFASDNQGRSWTKSKASASSGDVESIVIDPHTPSTLYASALGVRGILKSTDGGRSWGERRLGGFIRTVAIDPAAPATLYAGAQDGIFKSTDAGVSWTRSGLSGAWVSSIAVDPATSTVFANTSQGFFRTSNGGADWTLSGDGLPLDGYPHPIGLAPGTSTLYAGADRGIYRSLDGGRTFKPLTRDGPYYVLSLAFDPTDAHIVYAGLPTTVWRTTDSGKTWHDVGRSFPPTPQIRSLAVDPTDHAVVYAGTYGMSIFKTWSAGD
jgi:hypothetical protein